MKNGLRWYIVIVAILAVALIGLLLVVFGPLPA
jgi:hypothetical protein